MSYKLKISGNINILISDDGISINIPNGVLEIEREGLVRKEIKAEKRGKVYHSVKRFVVNKLRELRDKGVERIRFYDIFLEFNKLTNSKSRECVYTWLRKYAGRYGFSYKRKEGYYFLIKKGSLVKEGTKRRRRRRNLKEVLKLILSNVRDEIEAREVFKKAKIEKLGGSYYRILKEACEEQGFSIVERRREGSIKPVKVCVRRGVVKW